MTPRNELDFDQFLLQLSALRNDIGEAASLSVEKRTALRDFGIRLDASGEAALLDPSLWVA